MWINELDIRNIRLADFDDDFNKTRQSASDVILQEGGRSYRYSDASQKNHVWARWGKYSIWSCNRTITKQAKKTAKSGGQTPPKKDAFPLPYVSRHNSLYFHLVLKFARILGLVIPA